MAQENDFYFGICKTIKKTDQIPSIPVCFDNLCHSFYKVQFILMVSKRSLSFRSRVTENIKKITVLFTCDDRDIRKKSFQIALLISFDYRKDLVAYKSKFLSYGSFKTWISTRKGVCEFMLESTVFRDLQTLKLATKLAITNGYDLDLVPIDTDNLPQSIIDLFSDHDSDLISVLDLLLRNSKYHCCCHPFEMFIKFMELVGFDESVIVDMILGDIDEGSRLTVDYLKRILNFVASDRVAFCEYCDKFNDGTDVYESVRLTMIEVCGILLKGTVLKESDLFMEIL